MNELTPVMDDNRYVAEKLGIWHDTQWNERTCKWECSCGVTTADQELAAGHILNYKKPDFADDPVRLLEAMGDSEEFIGSIATVLKVTPQGSEYNVSSNYITEPGLLLKEVRKWFEGKDKL